MTLLVLQIVHPTRLARPALFNVLVIVPDIYRICLVYNEYNVEAYVRLRILKPVLHHS